LFPVSAGLIQVERFVTIYLIKFFRGVIDMKKAYRNMSGLNTADFDNWLEPTTIKMYKHAKSNKDKLWSDTENGRNDRKKKREARSYS
jgi:hypothetical protein